MTQQKIDSKKIVEIEELNLQFSLKEILDSLNDKLYELNCPKAHEEEEKEDAYLFVNKNKIECNLCDYKLSLDKVSISFIQTDSIFSCNHCNIKLHFSDIAFVNKKGSCPECYSVDFTPEVTL